MTLEPMLPADSATPLASTNDVVLPSASDCTEANTSDSAADSRRPEIEPESAAKVVAVDATNDEPNPSPLGDGVMAVVEGLLKSPGAILSQPGTTLRLLIVLATCHLVYGLICGSFSGGGQWMAAPVKVLAGAFAAGLLCLPSLYVFACLSGAKISVGDACKLLWGALSLTSLLLLGFAPVAFIFTFSVQSLAFMGCIHLGIWLVSIGFGIRFVLRGIEAKEGCSSGIMVVWSLVLVLTTLQMTTTLRPILGKSDQLISPEKKFFLVHWTESVQEEATAMERPAQREQDVAASFAAGAR